MNFRMQAMIATLGVERKSFSRHHGGTQVKVNIAARLKKRKKRLLKRLAIAREYRFARGITDYDPVMGSNRARYELSQRLQATNYGGVSTMLKLARHVGLVDHIDQRLRLLKVHAPYHESDHVLAIAANALCGGKCLEDLEILRNDSAFLDAVGAESIPDPTTAGDFCRRFQQHDIDVLMAAVNDARIAVWKQQDESFFEQANIDVDGVIVATKGECKQGMDITYKGSWGYHPLLITLANTRRC
jgi:hypothetical protein